MVETRKFRNVLALLIPSERGGGARQGLQLLLMLRTFVTAVSSIGLLLFRGFSTLEIPMTFILWLLATVVLSIILGYWRLRASWVMSNGELFCHLLVDVVFLFILLLNTGGVTNPLISYLLVLLAVTATLLPRAFVNSFAVGSILIYTFFLILDLQADHSPSALDQEIAFQLHLVGMWVIFLVSAILISVFITRMASAIKDRELNLAQAREKEMRNEQLVAIGTLAAGTAHALGTPLSTMAVLLTELDKQDGEQLRSGETKEDISILKQQVTRCKDSLTQLTRYYNKEHPEQEERVALPHFVSDIRDYITNIHPSAAITFDVEVDDDTEVDSNPSLKHAVINIIENGIKAARTRVDVNFKVVSEDYPRVEIAVNDDGPGIPSEVMENMGEPFISVRKESMGLGIFLANAAIQRIGGSIEMFNLKTGGALTLIKLPLADYNQS